MVTFCPTPFFGTPTTTTAPKFDQHQKCFKPSGTDVPSGATDRFDVVLRKRWPPIFDVRRAVVCLQNGDPRNGVKNEGSRKWHRKKVISGPIMKQNENGCVGVVLKSSPRRLKMGSVGEKKWNHRKWVGVDGEDEKPRKRGHIARFCEKCQNTPENATFSKIDHPPSKRQKSNLFHEKWKMSFFMTMTWGTLKNWFWSPNTKKLKNIDFDTFERLTWKTSILTLLSD